MSICFSAQESIKDYRFSSNIRHLELSAFRPFGIRASSLSARWRQTMAGGENKLFSS